MPLLRVCKPTCRWVVLLSLRGAGLKRQRFILSQLWRLGVCNQDARRAMVPLKSAEKNLCLPLASAGCWQPLAFLDLELRLSDLCLPLPEASLHVSVHISFFGIRPLLIDPEWLYLTLSTPAKTLFSSKVLFSGSNGHEC